MKPYALQIRAGIEGRAKGRWGLNCLYQGKLCSPEPHPDPVLSEIPGDPGQSHRWPTQAGRHRVHQTDNASPSKALCAGFPSGQKEGTISGACFLLGGHGGPGIAPARLRTLGFRPEPQKKDRDLGMAQDPVLVCCTPWQRQPEWPEELGRRRGLGNGRSFRPATTAFHLLPASKTRWPVATDRCKEAKSQVPGPIPPSPASAAPTLARPRTQPLCQATGAEPPMPHKAAFVSSVLHGTR